MTQHAFKVGDRAEISVEITEDLVNEFAEWSGDRNPLHLDRDYAESTMFHRRVAHGMSFGALFSRLIGMDIPGPGALWLSQSFNFKKPAFIGDTLTLRVEVSEVNEASSLLSLACSAVNQLSEEIMSGSSEVMYVAPEAGNETEPSADGEGPGTVVVTGASRGIGAAVARKLDAEGYNVGIVYRTSRSEADALAASLKNAAAVSADLSVPGQAANAVREIRKRLGPVTGLVLNAGDRDLYGPAAGEGFDLFSRHFTIQVESAHALVSEALPDMQNAGKGSIVAIGSTYAIGTPPANMAPYVVGKAALAGLMRCLAVDFGPAGIRANLVAPGMTETALLSAVPGRQRKVAAMQNPSRRLGQPEDVAGAVAYLLGDDARYVNGETLVVSGGAVMQ